MPRLLTVLLILLCVCTFASGQNNVTTHHKTNEHQEITTRDGKTYLRCKILRTEPDGIVIMHTKGIKKLTFDELPAHLTEKHAVELPWFIEPKEAAEYWPDSIQDVLDTIAPEIKYAKAAHEVALEKLENPAGIDYWHSRFGQRYAYVKSQLLRVGVDVARVRGEVLSIVDRSTLLVIDSDGDVTAWKNVSTTGLADGDSIAPLGSRTGIYEYTTAFGASKHVHLYEYMPSISLEDFAALGERAFSEIAEAKQRLIADEQKAKEHLLNAGLSTYERLLSKKKKTVAARARDRAYRTRRESTVRESKKQQESATLRQKKAVQDERRREAASAHREKWRMKGSEDFR